jgi:hypothetical protein
MGFGIKLAEAESPSEIAENDAILAARAKIEYYELSRYQILNVTSLCLAQWEREVLGVNDNQNENQNQNGTVAEIQLPEIVDVDEDGDGLIEINRTELERALTECAQSFMEDIQAFQEVSANNSEAFDSLSFNWNRCWPLKSAPQFIFYPTEEMILLANPYQQEEYYKEEWTTMQQELYERYLPPNATEEEEYDAFLRSIEEATGSDACEENMGGTTWFFFTIMTTVGYGNQVT